MNRLKKCIPRSVRPWFSPIKAGVIKCKKNILPSNTPHFLIIGAPKAGTTSLYYYLNQHPKISGGVQRKEANFFNINIHLGKKFADYRKEFSGLKNKYYFDATPLYLYYPGCAKNIADLIPDARLIVILRDPVQRAYSQWNHHKYMFENGYYHNINNKPKVPGDLRFEKFVKNRKVFPSFRECIEIEFDLIKRGGGFTPEFLRAGLYLEQLNIYWEYFDQGQMLILGFKDLVNSTRDTLRRVFDFVGAPNYDLSSIKLEPKNKKDYVEPMKEEDRAILEEFYTEPNRQLFEAIGPINW